MRLVNADAYSAEMKDRQEAAWKWRNEAIAEEDELKLARAEGAFTAFTEAKLTMDKHIINPWRRVEEELPKHGQRILICLRFTDLDGEEEPAKTVYGYFENFEKKGRRYWTWEDEEAHMQACMSKESDFEPEYGTTRITHWMPLPEPPKEDA